MARTAAARKWQPSVIHPASKSRIARAALTLTGEPTPAADLPDLYKSIVNDRDVERVVDRYGIRPILKALEGFKDLLNERLVRMTKQEGEKDPNGKIRYETDAHKFLIIDGCNVSWAETALRKAMTDAGISPKQQDKILKKAENRVDYQYVGVYPKRDQQSDGDEDDAS